MKKTALLWAVSLCLQSFCLPLQQSLAQGPNDPVYQDVLDSDAYVRSAGQRPRLRNYSTQIELLKRMTVEEKVGQMTQLAIDQVTSGGDSNIAIDPAKLEKAIVLVRPQKAENLALTPPMGWNSWNKFGCDVDEKLIRETADNIVKTGMKAAGYEYVIIDDCWHGERDAKGFIQPDPVRFPSGMKALGDYIHSKGLKFGIYSDVGAKTCGGRPGSRGYEYQDALVYASWGVDYLKYDWCNSEGLNPIGAYTTMRDALYRAGRPVVFSICEWGDNKPWEWAKNVGHLWRTTGDITACWDCEKNHGTWSSFGIMRILDKQKGLRIHAGPGRWNDPDMMEVGNGMSHAEDRAHFSMWAMLAAPLIAGNDVRNLSNATREILTNKEVIAIDQDPLGIGGFPAISEDGVEIWAKPLSNDAWAICFLNRNNESRKIVFNWKEHFIKDDFAQRQLDARKVTYKVRDLWKKADIGTTADATDVPIGAHDVVVLRLSR